MVLRVEKLRIAIAIKEKSKINFNLKNEVKSQF